jgi:hypothetical protein
MQGTMNRLLLWITTAVLGAAAAILSGSFGLLVAFVFLLLTVPLILRGDRAVALSGLLTGFGAFWSVLMAGQFASAGTTDNAAFWIAVGGVPLVVGCALIVLIAARSIGKPTAAAR